MSNLREKCKQSKDLINDSIYWINNNIDKDEARPILSNLKDLRADARNLETYSDGRPTLAVFGESQIGKSYFMSELLKNKDENKFYLKFKSPSPQYQSFIENGYLDFLSRVNPSGGTESSGIVTRFTISDEKQKPEAQIPVKFLRQIDLAIILADTYALDINNTSELDDYEYNEIVSVLQQLSHSKTGTEVDGMDENDIVDFKNYLNKYLKENSRTISIFNKNKIWDDIIVLLPRIPYSERYKIFELFWGKVSIFTQMFNHLSDILKKIDFINEGNLELNAILPKELDGKSYSVIDVRTLEDFLSTNKLPPLNIHINNKLIENIGIGEVTAIVREMTLTVDDRILNDDKRKFLNNVDVFDFPGAKTRQEFDVSKVQSLSSFTSTSGKLDDNILYMCLVRGKVHYLFNYYSDMNDLTSLIFAQKNSNQLVNTLPKSIDNWVVNTHGNSPEERIGKDNNLFISFHFFNIELNGKPSDVVGEPEQYNSLWKNRIQYNIEEFVGEQIRVEDNWIQQWTPNNRFKNFFFLRDPDPSFNSATRIDSNGNEVYNEGFDQKHKEMKQSFISEANVKKYINDPLKLWENSATLGNTGTEYIVENISPVTTMSRREEQITNRLSKVLDNAIDKITPFFKSGDYDEEFQKVQTKTKESMKNILIAMKSKNSFGNILFNLELPEDLAWKTLYDVQNPIFDHSTDEDGSIISQSSSGTNDHSNMIDIDIGDFEDEFDLDFDEPMIDNSKKNVLINIHEKHKTKSEIFVDKLLANWMEYTEERFNEKELIRNGITKETANWITLNLKESFSRINFKEFLSSKVEDEIDRYIQNTDSIFLVSRLSKNYFNEFINSYGWIHEPLNKRPFMKDGSILFANEEKDEDDRYIVKSLNHNEIRLDNDFPGKVRFNHWLKGFQEASKSNLDYKYSDGAVISNPEENTKLGTIIESFAKIN